VGSGGASVGLGVTTGVGGCGCVTTGRQALIYAAALLPLSLAPTVVAMTGNLYLAGAAIMKGNNTLVLFKSLISEDDFKEEDPAEIRIEQISSQGI
jgi:heme O synthase-like polyprenyltransferase